jgi:hypothetical protein
VGLAVIIVALASATTGKTKKATRKPAYLTMRDTRKSWMTRPAMFTHKK